MLGLQRPHDGAVQKTKSNAEQDDLIGVCSHLKEILAPSIQLPFLLYHNAGQFVILQRLKALPNSVVGVVEFLIQKVK